MNYPRFGPCPYCGEPLYFAVHRSAYIVGLVAGVVTMLVALAFQIFLTAANA